MKKMAANTLFTENSLYDENSDVGCTLYINPSNILNMDDDDFI